MRASVLAALNEYRRAGRAIVRATDLETGEDRLIDPSTDNSALGEATAEAAHTDRSGPVEIDGRQWLLTVFNPPLELVICGAVHIAQPLSRVAVLAGYRVRIVDPRTAFASEARFPGAVLDHQWPDDALKARPLSTRSALVVLAHDPKLDDPALAAALASPCFYIGALGSKKTHAGRMARLRSQGYSDEALSRIHAPVGVAIGARSPAEIAIAIMAEITQVLRAGGKREQPTARDTAQPA